MWCFRRPLECPFGGPRLCQLVVAFKVSAPGSGTSDRGVLPSSRDRWDDKRPEPRCWCWCCCPPVRVNTTVPACVGECAADGLPRPRPPPPWLGLVAVWALALVLALALPGLTGPGWRRRNRWPDCEPSAPTPTMRDEDSMSMDMCCRGLPVGGRSEPPSGLLVPTGRCRRSRGSDVVAPCAAGLNTLRNDLDGPRRKLPCRNDGDRRRDCGEGASGDACSRLPSLACTSTGSAWPRRRPSPAEVLALVLPPLLLCAGEMVVPLSVRGE